MVSNRGRAWCFAVRWARRSFPSSRGRTPPAKRLRWVASAGPSPTSSPRNLWQILGRVPHLIAARVLGWGPQVEARLGPPPPWAKCFAAGSLPVGPFLQTLHALVARNEAAVENWPRVGLEAMAAGVPVVAEAQGGWNEMIRHGQTGYLARSDDELAYYTARLAYDEEHRLAIARRARAALVEQLADPRAIGQAWLDLFGSLR